MFDQNTGAVRRRGTVQGYSNSSTWSRGQAWAVYGFTLAYRETGDARMLDTARRVADYYVSHLPADSVPYWDFQAPGIPNEPRDSSAAAIAASGLIELAQLDPDVTRSRRYLGVAQATLASLSSPAYLAEGTSSRSILLHGTSNKPAGEYDRGLIYGDYYFLEALLRYRDIATASNPRADFNGDGYGDAAIGAPGEDGRAGAVNVAYGSGTAITSTGAGQFGQSAAGGSTEGADRFGGATASGDFNRDGYADLAVGAPGEDGEAGAVNVLNGSSGGLTSTGARQIAQSTANGANEAGDLFGTSVTAADFNGDGYCDLAVGAPGEDITGALDVGHVTIFYGGASGLTGSGAQTFSQSAAGGSPVQADRFGEALASGYLNGDTRADLVAGAPGEGNGAGAVNVLYGSTTGLTSSGARQFAQASAAGATEAGDHFGAALATGRFNGDAYTDVAIGAPDEGAPNAAASGVVNVMYGFAGGLASAGAQQIGQALAAGNVEAGDRFGASLAGGDFDGDGRSDLAAGAPNEDSAAGVDIGATNVMNGSAGGLVSTGARELNQGSANGQAEPGDRFGSAVGAGNLNGDARSDLIVGAPYEDTAAGSDVGVFNMALGGVSGLTSTGSRQLDQGNAGGVAEAGDLFGSALR